MPKVSATIKPRPFLANPTIVTAGICGLGILAPVIAGLLNPLLLTVRPTVLIPFYDIFTGLGIFTVLLAIVVAIACLLTLHFFGKTGAMALRILLIVLVVGWSLTTTITILGARINWDKYQF